LDLNQLKYVECINYLDSISNLFSFKNDIHTQTKVIGFKSTIYSNLGLFTLSNELGFIALEHFNQNKDSVHYYNLTQTIAYNSVQLGDYEKALHFYNQSSAFYKRNTNKKDLVYNYLNVGDLFWTMNRFTDAERSFLLALNLAKELKQLDMQILSLRYLGLITQADGNLKKAQEYIVQAEKIVNEHHLTVDESQIKHTRMLIEVAAKNWDEARKLMDWLDSTNTSNLPELRVPKSTRIRYLLSQNKVEEAQIELEKEEKDSSFPLNPIHKKWFEIWIKANQNPKQAESLLAYFLENEHSNKVNSIGNDYHKALMSALNSGLIKQAIEPIFNSIKNEELVFKMNELIKGNLLSNRLEQNNYKDSSELDSLKRLSRQTQEQISLMKLNKKPSELIQISEQKLTDLYEKIDKKNSSSITVEAIKHGTIKDAQDELSEDQLFIHVLETELSYQILAITAENAVHFTIENKNKIEKDVQSLIDACKNPTKKWNVEISDEIKETLFPIDYLDIIEFKEITISADGIWTAFPFETLTDKGKFLAETHTIRYLSSISVANRLQKLSNQSNSDSFLVFSNPEFPESSSWKSLPFTKLEAESIKKTWGNARVFSDSLATVSNFKNELLNTDYNVIHIATHGVTDKTPDRNRLVFSYKNDESFAYFFPHSLSSNSIKAKLIVLSACETAAGQYISGEGIWGMQRSWINAGAESVLAGLWQVNDKSTALFMESFYNSINEQNTWINRTIMNYFANDLSFSSRAIAVSEAKKNMIKKREFSHPYYWAGLMYFGL